MDKRDNNGDERRRIVDFGSPKCDIIKKCRHNTTKYWGQPWGFKNIAC